MVADLADAFKITGHGGHGARSGADDRLGDEADDVFRSQPQQFFFQFIGDAQAISFGRLARLPIPVFVAGCDMRGVYHERGEGLFAPGVSADSEGGERVAVIALTPGDEARALGLANLEAILPGQFQRRFDRFGAAGNEIHPVDSIRCVGNQPIGQ